MPQEGKDDPLQSEHDDGEEDAAESSSGDCVAESRSEPVSEDPATGSAFGERVGGDVVDEDGRGTQQSLPGIDVHLQEVAHTQAQFHTGPLPDPQTLAAYESVVPGLAERIVSMAEESVTSEARSRAKLDDAAIDAAKTGQSLAFFLVLICLGLATWMFIRGDDVAGGIFLSPPVLLFLQTLVQKIRD